MPKDEFQVGKAKVRLVLGDITEVAKDAIVNAANSSLLGGGGVDGAIHRKGGPAILAECKKTRQTQWLGGLPTGKAVVTTAGNLKAKRVVHTVGPIWYGGEQGEPELLAMAYENSLTAAVSDGLKTIAFPSISTGAYGYPVDRASRIALRTTRNFLASVDQLDEVVFVLFSDRDLQIYRVAALEVFRDVSG